MIAIPRRVSFNLLTNTLSTVLNALCGFLILPFLIDQLGRETYGLWTLIVATVGYFMVLDFGVNGALGRLIAGYRAKDNIAATNEVMSTTLVLLLGVCAFVIVITLFIHIPFFWLFQVPAGEQDDVRAALLIIGITTALSFPGTVGYGFLYGYERFDLYNMVEIPTVLIRTGLTLWLIHSGSGLVELAWIVAGTTVASYLVRAFVCWWLEPRLRLRLRLFSRPLVYEIFAFGFWFSLMIFSRAALPNVAPFVIGHGLGAAAVTTYTIPRMLVTYSSWITVSATQAVAPRAAVYHFGQEHEKQQELFLGGGRYACALSLFFVGGAVLLGLPLLNLWQGGVQRIEYDLLIVLILGEAIPMSQWITYNAIVSMGRHRRLALFGFAEGLTILVLSSAVIGRYGLFGVACAVALSALLFRGLLQWTYGCALVQVSLLRYARFVFLPIGLAALLAFGLFGLLRLWFVPETWFSFLLAGALYGALYWAIMVTLLPPLFTEDAEQRPQVAVPMGGGDA
jgi:O-antigen/teichoic acid export membrane protein